MATDIGDLRLTASADTSDLEQKLSRAGDALDDVGTHAKGMGADTQAAFTDFQKTTQVALDHATKQIDELKQAIAKLNQTTDDVPTSTKPATDSMADFKDGMGDADSSLQGMAGAVDHVNPKLAGLMRVTGDFAGGAEAAAKGGGLMAKSLGALTSPLGLVALGAATVGATLFALSRDAGRAAIQTEHLEGALKGLKDSQAAVSASRLQLRVESGELSDLEAQLLNVSQTVKKEMAPSLEAAMAPFQEFTEDVDEASKMVSKLEEGLFLAQSGAIPATGEEIHNVRDALQDWKGTLREARSEMDQATNGMDDSAIALRGVNDNIEEQIELRTQLLGIRIQEAKDRAEEKAERDAAAKRAERRRKQLERQRAAEEALRKEQERRTETQKLLAGEAAVAFEQEVDALFKLKDAANITADTFDFLANEASLRYQKAVQDEIDARRAGIDEILKIAEDANADIISEREALDLDMQTRTEEEYARSSEVLKSINDAEAKKLAFVEHRLQQQEISEEGAAAAIKDIEESALLERLHLEDAHEQALTALHENESRRRIEITENERAAQIAQLQEVMGKAQEFAGASSEMMKAFNMQQAAAVLQATINGAVAITKTLAELGPVGIPLSALIAGTTAAQIAVIQSQKPSFHQGGIISGDGDQAITAQGGEAVLNRNAVANLGAGGVDTLNAGAGMGGSVTVNIVYRQQLFNQMVIDNIKGGGALAVELRKVQQKAAQGMIGGAL